MAGPSAQVRRPEEMGERAKVKEILQDLKGDVEMFQEIMVGVIPEIGKDIAACGQIELKPQVIAMRNYQFSPL